MEPFNAVRDAFEQIYDKDTWIGGSGPGSLPSSTGQYRQFVETFVYENDIKTVTDLGCGDWQFSKYISWSDAEYTGLDIVPSLIERNNRIFGADKIKFKVSENLDSLPGGDLILCKEVFQHLPNDLIFQYLAAIKAKYKYALITNSVAPGTPINTDIVAGGYRPLRIDLAPFNVRGAIVLTYFPVKPTQFQVWKNNVFLAF